ncbi:MAG: hypothetical protein F6K16_09995 [Symploca sp. SIO2B6]|nr:hypothetical protein [Symploca sp. SIO2B6]
MFVGSTQAARLMGISARRIRQLLSGGRIYRKSRAMSHTAQCSPSCASCKSPGTGRFKRGHI